MKKKYEKPVFVFENFSLNTSIAGGCAMDIDTFGSGECGLDWGGEMIFLSGITECTRVVTPDDGINNMVCYHNPSDTNNLFNS